MNQLALNMPIDPEILDKWKKEKFIKLRKDGNEKERIVIALRGTEATDTIIEYLLRRYVDDRNFRKRIDEHLAAKEEIGLPRLIAISVQHGIDSCTYFWRREILSKIAEEEKADGYVLIKCSDETPKKLQEIMAPFN